VLAQGRAEMKVDSRFPGVWPRQILDCPNSMSQRFLFSTSISSFSAPKRAL
jgi:hypothetical protein